ncbi:MAG: efflux RND transporter periplasmic adaptor subunit [Myxococcota bacterium]
MNVRWHLAVCLTFACASQEPSPPPPPSVRVAQAEIREVKITDDYVATVRSRSSSEIRPEVTGRLTSISVKSGQRVEIGNLLMEIDASQQSAVVSSARAATLSATADLQAARAALVSLRAQREARRSDLKLAEQRQKRIQQLFASDNASQADYDEAVAGVRSAQAQLDATEAQIAAQQSAIAGTRAAVSSSVSSLQEGQAELDDFSVSAPIGGTLGDIPVRVGDLVTPSTVLTQIEGSDSLELYVRVPAEKLPLLRDGLEVDVLDSTKKQLGETRVDFVGPNVDPVTQTVLVKAPLPSNSGFRVGQFLRARVVWETTTGPTVPTTAVSRINTQPFLFIVGSGAPPTVEQRPVQLGPLQNQRYLVTEGLKTGEEFVVAGIQRLADGRPVSRQLSSAKEPNPTPDENSGRKEPSDDKPRGADTPGKASQNNEPDGVEPNPVDSEGSSRPEER